MPNQKGSLVISILFVSLVVLVMGYILVSKFPFSPKSSQIIHESQTEISTKSDANNKIAYIKDKKLYILDGFEFKFIAENIYNNKYKYSPDGKYLAWINKDVVKIKNPNFPEGYPVDVGVSLSVLDLTNNKVQTLIPRQFTDEMFAGSSSKFREGSIWKYNFDDFDFVDSDTIVYIREGVRTIKLSDALKSVLIEPDFNPDDSFPGPSKFGEVDASPNGDKLLLLESGYECDPGISRLYDLTTKQFKELDGLGSCDSTRSIWSSDGKSILTYDEGGNVPEGMWILNPGTETKKMLVEKRTVDTASIFNENLVAGFLTDYAMDDAPSFQSGIYKTGENGKLLQIVDSKNVFKLSFNPDGKSLIYMIKQGDETGNLNEDQRFNLIRTDLNGNQKKVLIQDVSSYQLTGN